jgi:hypothetical protein
VVHTGAAIPMKQRSGKQRCNEFLDLAEACVASRPRSQVRVAELVQFGCDLSLHSRLGGCSIACDQPGEPTLSLMAFGNANLRAGRRCTKAVGRLTGNITPVETVKPCYPSETGLLRHG